MESRVRLAPRALIIAQLLAFCPVWVWFAWRLTSCPNQWWEALPLVSVAVVLYFRRANAAVALTNRDLLLPLALTALYAVVYPRVPELLRAALAFTALTGLLSVVCFRCRFSLGLWVLMLLGLQLHNGLQFYLGYPLRVLCAAVVAPLLCLTGFRVTRQGTCLDWSGELILIDAPCSGVKMLWTGMFLTALLACYYNFNAVRTIVIGACTLVIVLAANILRAASLFYVEAGIFNVPAWSHDAVGMIVFAAAVICIAAIAEIIARRKSCALPS